MVEMAPEALLTKFLLLQAVPFDARFKRRHHAVYGFILGWYRADKKDALASVRFIEAKLKERDPWGRGFAKRDIHEGLQELTAWGYLTCLPGRGNSASRYVPRWDAISCVRDAPDTNQAPERARTTFVHPCKSELDDSCVRDTPDACVRDTPDTKAVCVRRIPDEYQSTSTRSTETGTEIDGHDCAAPSAPPAPAAHAPGGADTAQGFEALWIAYGLRQQKAKARGAYERLAPSADTHAEIMQSAKAWRAAWEAQGNPDAPRKALHTWLEKEDWQCDPPRAYAGKRKANPTMPTVPPVPAPKPAVVEIIGAKVSTEDGRTVLTVTFNNGASDSIVVESASQGEQTAGQERLRELCRAIGQHEIEDSAELLGRRLTLSGKRFLAANDNMEGEKHAVQN